MPLRIKRLHGVDLKRFRTSIKKPDLPMDYLISGACYGFFSMGEMVAGYCLVHNPLEELASIQQIPEADRKKLGNEDPFKFAELTGFFLKSKKYRIVIKLHLLMKLMFHKASYFVYAYPTDQKHIERQAALGNPLRIYTGKPELAIGGDGILLPSSINVEIISKWGILKIASYQAAKKIRRWAYRLCNRS